MFSQPSGRFGSALAVLDFNKDGLPDLAVGAPSVGSEQLTYNVSWEEVRGRRGQGWERCAWQVGDKNRVGACDYRLGGRDKNGAAPFCFFWGGALKSHGSEGLKET